MIDIISVNQGLAKSSQNSTFLDGSPFDSTSWWYAICSYSQYPTTGEIPGIWFSENGVDFGAKEVSLYIRTLFLTSNLKRNHIENHLFITIYILVLIN